MPAEVVILYQGQARLLGYDPRTQTRVTLQKLGSGEIIGACSLVRGVACESASASVESICLTLPAIEFLALLEQQPALAAAFRDRCFLIEVFDLLGAYLERLADAATNLKQLAQSATPEAVVCYIPTRQLKTQKLDSHRLYHLSLATAKSS